VSELQDLVVSPGTPADFGASVAAPNGEAWHHRGDLQLPSASTVKIPIMVTIYRMIDRGALALDQRYTLTEADRTPGSGVLQHLHAGLELTLADLLYLMISISDNPATNILVDMAGLEHVNATMQELGMASSVLGRPMRGRLAIAGEQENLATANDYIRVLDAIVSQRAASPQSCQAMLETLRGQQNHKRIGRHVPRTPAYRWGSKTGSNEGIVNDVGYVSGPAGTLLLAAYCRGVPDEVSGEAVVAEFARRAMRATGLLTG
jgi:beta-lactamase class A